MNDSTNKPQFDFQEVIDRASKRLQDAVKVPFSDQAFQAVKEEISAYAEELIDASEKRLSSIGWRVSHLLMCNRQPSIW